MMKITRPVQAEVEVSSREMGQLFAAMDSLDQAMFFQGVADGIKYYKVLPCFQWSYLREELDKNPEALATFKDMAEYAE